MSLPYEMMKLAAHTLLEQGRIYCKALNNEGEPVYVHADYATEADKEFSKNFLAQVSTGEIDTDGSALTKV